MNMTTSLKQRVNLGLKLNTCQKSFGEENIVITNSSETSYTIQNHPRYTDQNEFSYSTQKKYDHIFFTSSNIPDNGADKSETGECYQIIQKANGKEQQDKVNSSAYIRLLNTILYSTKLSLLLMKMICPFLEYMMVIRPTKLQN